MTKTLLTIEQPLLDFLRSDAQKEHRTTSAQVCALLELCREYGGYSRLVRQLIKNEIAVEQTTRKPTGTAGRPHKQKPIDIQVSDGYGCTLMLKNRTKQRGLVVLYDSGDYYGAAEYVRDSLIDESFDRADVQRDYSEACDRFTIYEIQQDTPEAARAMYKGDFELYPGYLDLTGENEKD